MNPTPAIWASKSAASETAKSAAKSCGAPPVRLTTISLTMACLPPAQKYCGPSTVTDHGPRRSESCAPLFLRSVRLELADIGPEALSLGVVLDPAERHAGARDH